MNPASAVTTGAVGLSVAQTADIIAWLSHWPIHAPPQNVSLAVAAFIVAGGHAVWNMIRARMARTKSVPSTATSDTAKA